MDGASHLSDEVARVCKRGKRRVDFSALFLGWQELAGQRSYGVYRKYYITCKRHIQSSAKAWKSVSSSSIKTLRLPRAKAQRVL